MKPTFVWQGSGPIYIGPSTLLGTRLISCSHRSGTVLLPRAFFSLCCGRPVRSGLVSLTSTGTLRIRPPLTIWKGPDNWAGVADVAGRCT
jgi:hypothetical protein